MKRPIATDVTTWPAEWLFLFQERAAIREFDGHQPRYQAEASARREVWNAQQSGELFTEGVLGAQKS